MMASLRVRAFWRVAALAAILTNLMLCPLHQALADVYDWDNYTGDKKFRTALNWEPTINAPPGPGDMAIFDGQLLLSGPDKMEARWRVTTPSSAG